MSLVLWIVLGALAGWVASMIMGNDARQGWLGNIIVGVVGALVGGWLVGGLLPGSGDLGTLSLTNILVAIIGAVVVLFVYNLITGRRGTSV